jgi:hypothetical protein
MNKNQLDAVCGKKALRRRSNVDQGVKYMSVDEMKKFIRDNGTADAKKKLKTVMKRGELCEIFHSFKAGLDEIKKSFASNETSPKKPAQAARRVMNNVNSGSNKAGNASPTESEIERKLNNFASSQERKKRANKNNAKNNHFGLIQKREYPYGVRVLTRAPNRHVNNAPGRSGSNRSSGNNRNNFGGNWSSNNGRGQNVHFGKLMTKHNKGKGKVMKQVSKAQQTYLEQRVGKGNRPKTMRELVANARIAKRNSSSNSNAPSSLGSRSSGSSSGSSSPRKVAMKKAVRKPTFMAFPSVGGEVTRRKPTRSVPYHLPGTRSHVSKNQLKFANEERWRRLRNNQQWLKLNAMNKGVVGNKNKAAQIANNKAMMANKVLQEIIKNIKNGKLAVTTRVAAPSRAAATVKRNVVMRNLFGSSGSSSENVQATRKQNTVKRRLAKKLSRRRVRPTVPAAMTVAQAQRVVRVRGGSNSSK